MIFVPDAVAYDTGHGKPITATNKSQASAKVLPFVKRSVTRKANVVSMKREVRALAMAA